jgi:hypothetical protein
MWLDVSGSAEGTSDYLKEYVFEVADFNAYLEKIGGLRKLQSLKEIEQLRSREAIQ